MSSEALKGSLTPTQRKLLELRLRGLGHQRQEQTIRPRGDQPGPLPLSFAQQRLWFLQQLEPDSSEYTIPRALRVRGALDGDALERALNEIVSRHESLRTSFGTIEGSPVQVISEAAELALARVELSQLDESEREHKAESIAAREALRPFDLARGPLLRATLIRLDDDDHVLVLVMHHIVSDGWSMGVLTRELSALYEAFSSGAASPLPEPSIQYADFTAWQRQWLADEVLEEQLTYWCRQLAGLAPVLELPTDHARPAVRTVRGDTHSFVLGPDVVAALSSLSRAQNATLFMTLLAAFQALLTRYSGQSDIAVGTPIAGRTHAELEDLIGFFVNTLVLRTDLSGDPSFVELLARVREVALGAYAHQDAPFEKLVEKLQPARSLSHTPLVQVMFSLEATAGDELALGDASVTQFPIEFTPSKFDLQLTLAESRDELMGAFDYNADLFEADTIARMSDHFTNLVAAMCASPETPLSQLDMLAEPERHHLIVELNDTAAGYPKDSCVHELFAAQVRQTPDAIALVCGDDELTYQELNAAANRLAHHLVSLGVGPGTLVGICLQRSLDLVVGLLGILKAGGAYVPLDPDYPQERVGFMLQDAGCEVVVTHSELSALIPGDAAVVLMDQDRDAVAAHPATDPERTATPDDLAYVIYTSGSTGTPKGVAVGHRGVCNRLDWMQRHYGIGPKDAVLQKTPFSFDVSVWEFFWTLMTGARLIMARPGGHKDPVYLAETIERHDVSVIHFVPSMLAAYLAGAPQGPHPRLTFCSGEALSPELARSFTERFDAELHNLYGPTEASVDVTFYALDGDEDATVPIGRPIANTQIYLLDAFLNPVPIGVPGELYIGGAGLARGYLNRAGLTAERFVPDPFATTEGGRLYRTGDLARYLPDGDIEFLGRADHQVKIRGFRIEPGEIEAALTRHPALADAVVIARSDGAADQRLVAYVVASNGAAPTTTELRAHLLESLPEHMVPAAFVTLDELPLTPNGKLDRAALPAPEGRPELEAAYVAPRTSTEEILASIWGEILGVERVGANDNFFELGGDSILSIQIIARAAQAGLRLTPKQLFQHQSVAALAAVAGTRAEVVAEQGAVTGALPLTPIQRWFFELDLPGRHHFNQSMLLAADGCDPELVENALAALVDHHDALRLRYQATPQGWIQSNAPAEDGDYFTVADLSDLDAEEQRRALMDATAELQAGLDLEHGPLIRACYLDFGERGARLFVCIHHLAVDGVSWRILLEDLETAYAQLASGEAVALPPKTTSFKQWAQRLVDYAASPEATAELDHWARLSEVAFELPRDHDRGPNDAASAASVTVALAEADTEALLREVPAAYRTQINDVLLAALADALARFAGRQSVVVDLEGHGREELFDDVDLTRTVGWFTSLFPVALQVTSNDKGALLKGIKEQLRAVPHRGLGYGVVRHLGAPEIAARVAARAPVSFNYLGRFGQETGTRTFGPASEATGPDVAAAGERAHEVDVNGVIRDGCLQMSWIYSTNLHDRATIEGVAGDFMTALRTLITRCTEPDAGGVTPSDFPLAALAQPTLDHLWAQGALDRATEDVYPLTSMQKGMVFHTLYAPDAAVYFEQLVMTLEGELDADALDAAWQQTTSRHAVLRSAVLWEAVDEPVQVVRRDVEVPFERHDLSALPAGERDAALTELLAADRARGFDLAVAPLQRVALVRMDERSHVVVWSHHHLLLDGWSTAILRAEILSRYHALARGEELDVTPARPYRDYIAWLESQDTAVAETYWRDRLAGFAAPTPLIDDGDTGEEGPSRHPVTLDPEVATALWALTRSGRVTLNTVIQGAWALLLSRYSGERDVVFGATVAGRPPDLAGVQEMVGLFINTVPVRVGVDGSHSALQWLGHLQADGIARFQFEHAALNDIQSWSEVPGGVALFDSIVVFENYPAAATGPGADAGVTVAGMEAFERTNYPLNLIAAPGPDIPLLIDYDSARFRPETVARMATHLATLLGAIAADPDAPLSELDMLDELERHHLTVELNDTAADYPKDSCVHELFAAQVAKSPGAVALVNGDDELTYEEVNERANRLAHHLISLGVGPDTLVGICLKRGIDLVVGLVAILKAGGAYVPVDADYPGERVAFMLEDSGAEVLVTHAELNARLPEVAATLVLVDADQDAIAACPATDPELTSSPDDLAYVIYTSGSTGTPKGAAVAHRAITPLVRNAGYITLTPEHKVAQASNSSFDAMTFELWGALTSGATLVVCPEDTLLSPQLLGDFLRESGVTTLFVTTALFNQIVTQDPSVLASLEHLLFGGEACDPNRVRQLLEETSLAGLRHVYGPTETTTFATWCPVHAGVAGGTVPIGRPIANTQVYILDRHGNPVPAGVPGELYIGGTGLARGYLNRAALTAERFVPDPFSGVEGARLYRTGDRARYLPDGNIEFLGRVDHQVKIRGFRIEPGEIEAALIGHDALRDAVVVARSDGDAKDKRLVAYVVAADGAAPTTTELRAHLLESLPDYMVPAAFVTLDELPLTPNGKLDRAALPAPEGRPELEAAYLAPRTPTEEILAGIWQEVLGLERVGVNDNFFELGGDSILSIQIIARAHQAGLGLSPKQIFEHQSVGALAAVAGERAEVVAEQGAVSGALPLTPIQRWFFELDLPQRHHFNQSMLVTADGCDPALVERALHTLVDHHDALRLRYRATLEGWSQSNGPAEDNDFFSVVDLSGLDAAAQDRAVVDVTAELQASLDLERGPLVRACHLDLGGRGARLFVSIHHLAVDGVSWRILLEDLETAYTQLAAGETVALAPKTTSFKQWAQRLVDYAGSDDAAAELEHWARLSEVAFELPRDHERGPNDWASAAAVTVALDEAETAALVHEVPAAYRTQINDVLLAALADTLARFAGRQTVLIDLEGHGREELFDDVDLTRTVGWFTSIFPVALEVTRTDKGALLKGIKEQLRAVPQRGLGYGVLRYLGDDDVKARLTAPAPVGFNYLGRFGQESGTRTFGPASEAIGSDVAAAGERVHDVDVNGDIRNGRLQLTWSYSRNLHERATIAALAEDFMASLRALIAHCAEPGVGGVTPSDFPLAALEQPSLDELWTEGLIDHDTEDLYPLTPMQQGMVFHTLYEPGSGVYFEQQTMTLEGELDADALQRAWLHTSTSHAVLRSAVLWEGLRVPVQVVRRAAGVPFERHDLSALPATEREAALSELLAADRARGFELDRPPLQRVALVRLDEHRHVVAWSFHHLLLDGWSMPVVVGEVFSRYRALVRGEELQLTPAPPYRDYIAWLHERDAAADETYWRAQLAGFAAPTPLEIDRAGAAQDAGGYAQHHLDLDEDTTVALESLARRERITLNTVIQGAWALLLSRYSGERDVVFGATVAGRPPELTGVEDMVGLFINTVPVRVDVAGDVPAGEWLVRLQDHQTQQRSFEHAALSDIQAWSELPGGTALFDSIVVFENYPVTAPADIKGLRGLELAGTDAVEQTNYPLTVVVEPGRQLSVTLRHDLAHLDAEPIARMGDHLVNLLSAIAAAPEAPLSELDMLGEPERRHLTLGLNDTGARYPQESCVHELFAAQVRETPDAVALVYGDDELTYEELNASANRLAHHLVDLGVGPDTLVGICLPRGLDMVVGLLAILKAGGAYVPLDPDYPPERLAFMLEDTGAEVLVTHSDLSDRVPAGDAALVLIDQDRDAVAARPDSDPGHSASPDHLAYVIYTSGSTGTPKGVMVTHANVTRLFAATADDFGFDERDVWLLFHSYAFDFSVWELWGALLYGGRLVVVPKTVARAPDAVLELVRRHGVTVLNQTPSAFRQLMHAEASSPAPGEPSLRLVVFGGEGLEPSSLSPWIERHGVDAPRLVNMYGITETTVHVTRHALKESDAAAAASPIGRPIADLQAYILDRHANPVPIGVPGELYVGGAGLARGYLNRAGLTAERFVPDPFSGAQGARLYRTGDRARYVADGDIEFLGRVDHQVKIRGFRIEPGEIEAVLTRHDAIKDAVVLAREDAPGDRRLVAYVVAAGGDVPTTTELRAHLLESLPEHMVPAAFVTLDELPLTPNGKLDRTALPAPDSRPDLESAYVAPRNATEEILAGIWSEVLGLERVGVQDNFFELGGHSLVATQVVARVRAGLGVELPLRALFESPTVTALAAAVAASGERPEAPPITSIDRDGDLPLSFAQQRLWFLDQLEPDSAEYNVPQALRVRGPLQRAALDRALSEFVARHESLRTTFATSEGHPVQVIAAPAPLQCELVDLSSLTSDERDSEAALVAAQEAARPFDLARGPLLRATLIALDADDHVLMLVMHHIVSDGWSLGVFTRELTALYDAFSHGRQSPLEELPLGYADYAAWQREWLRGDVLEDQLGYWRDHLAGLAPVLELPTDHSRPAVRSGRGATHAFALDAGVLEALSALSRAHNATLFMTLVSAFKLLLARYSGQNDIAVGTPIAGRTHAELEDLIGFFVNTLVLRTDLSGDPSFTELLARVREVALGAYAHQDVPFEKLVDELQPARSLRHTPLFQVMFTLDDAAGSELALGDASLTRFPSEFTPAKFDLHLALRNSPDALEGVLLYDAELFEPATIARMGDHLGNLLRAIAAAPGASLSELDMLDEAERHHLVAELNDTAADYPQDACVHELLSAQAAQTPDAVALVYGSDEVGYQELNERANRLANHLVSLGAGPGTLVGICLERSLDLVVGLLAILKAGGAYVPLDPDYPQERLAFMLEDTGARVLVTHSELRDRLPAGDAVAVLVDLDRDAIAASPATDPEQATGPDDLAYVAYTSGSTGTPKGVAVAHRGVVRLVRNTDYVDITPQDVFLQFAPVSFDASTFEIWAPLLNGARLALADPDELTLARLGEILERYGITVLWLTASLFNVMIETHPPVLEGVGQLLAGGDALSPGHVAEARAALPRTRLINGYGPTESTTFTCCYPIADVSDDASSVPIGRPIANTTVYLLDAYLNPVPLGVPGELYIGGDGLARGYLNRPVPTAERFVPDPFSATPGARLYRTGDRARFLQDGNIEFLGRVDHQVKIRGFRIEPGEIEAALVRHPALKDAVVVARHDDDPSDKRLVAYVVASADAPTTRELRAHLLESLPDYMVPSAFVALDELPLTPNGKLDRAALPAPDGRPELEVAYVAPRSPGEEVLAEIWCEVLGLERVGVHDDFFELGGNSLAATQVVARLGDGLGIKVAVRSVFEASTIDALAAVVEGIILEELEPVAEEMSPGSDDRAGVS